MTHYAVLLDDARIVDESLIEGRLADCVVEQRKRKWRWAGHIA